jgi:hypothetical protein
MAYVLAWILMVAVGWVALLITVLVGQRIVDMSLPPVKDLLWKAAVVVAIPSAVGIGLDFVNGWVSFVGAILVYIGLMEKLFDLDLWQIVAVTIINRFLAMLVYAAIMAATIVH